MGDLGTDKSEEATTGNKLLSDSHGVRIITKAL